MSKNSRPQLEIGNFYHVYNRGVDKRSIFSDNRDRSRFIHDLYEFNDKRDVINLYRLATEERLLMQLPGDVRKPRKLLVDLIAFALMPNHYHLLLRQRREDGISLFMKKLGGGYTNYFNERYERSGALFQGRYKVKHIDQEAYLRYLIAYIHANPLPILKPREVLEDYRWSSYPDYIHAYKNFPSLISWDIADELALLRGNTHRQDVLGLGKQKIDRITHLVFEEK